MPGSRLVLLPGVGRVSPLDAPEALTAALRDVLGTTEPAVADPDRFRALLRDGPADRRLSAGRGPRRPQSSGVASTSFLRTAAVSGT